MATHLATRSSYSLLQSTLTIDRLVSLAKERGFRQLAITENGVLFSAKAFQKACYKAGIKPIYGLEVIVDEAHYSVLAKNNEGFKELISLSSQINDKGVTLKDIAQLTHDCTVILHSDLGILDKAMLEANEALIREQLISNQRLFRDFWVGISMMQSPRFESHNPKLVTLSATLDIKCVALPKVYYADPDDEDAYRMLRAIDLGYKHDDHRLLHEPYRSLISVVEMTKIYPQELLINSDIIGEQCNVNLDEITTSLPIYNNPSNVSSEVYLRELCQVGLKKRFDFQQVPKNYQDRLAYELDVIIKMNYADYFLIVYDFILYANKQSIYVGPGRGSAAGSLVSYCLGITHVDPIAYNLFFERFLNPERVSMPDIDTDFPDNRRDEVIEYVIDKYGSDHIAHIITFGTLQQKQVIRDVGRVYNVSDITINKILKALVNRLNATLSDSLAESKSLSYLLKEDKDAKKIVDMALQIEGLPRNQSTHAAGIVMSRKPLTDVIATLRLNGSNHKITQYSMEYLEEMGLVKMDFLGLRNLTIIDDVVTEIKKHEPDFNILRIDLNDTKTYELIQKIHVVGIFQLESQGMKALLKQVHPTQFMDIADTIALYRPGPMRFRDQYVKNKRNPEKIVYLHPDLKEIAQMTYGILIYQEQIMQVAQKFAGFSLGKADVLRRAMSKKKADEMANLKEDFMSGCKNNGYTKELAQQLFDMVDTFAAYGFNKSHSVAYGMIAYQMAFLKANYPLFFYKALLSSVIGSQSKLKEYLDECKARKIGLLAPSVNHSQTTFSLEGGKIRLPLTMVSSLASKSANDIITIRTINGPYRSFVDFVAKSNAAGINRKQITNLIYSGACDEFGYNRSTLIASLDDVLQYSDLIKVVQQTNQESLPLSDVALNFNMVNEPVMSVRPENKLLLSQKEKEVLGLYFKYNPLAEVRMKHQLAQTMTLSQAVALNRQSSTIVAMVVSIKEIRSKKGDLMAFVTLEDDYSKEEAIIFNRDYLRLKEKLVVYQVYKVIGQGQKDRSYIINDLQALD